MSDVAIHVEGIGKSYRITHSQRTSYKTLQEDVIGLIKRPFERFTSGASPRQETFWALKDVSFDVKQGEVLGIIGRNGAGKSTLLKILSRITKPTVGYADVYGRVGSLLEVGTGFHPELTGRENVFLNGAILGMTRGEIQRHFDEIVEFAEIEQFLETPVKRYSSGMYMRLAFAVAAHLEPEILVVDEVLAVGDAKFQEKCLGKMSEVASGGRTVLFVSHNMAAVQHLCNAGILLEKGQIKCQGRIDEVVRDYTEKTSQLPQTTLLSDRRDRQGIGELRFHEVSILSDEGREVERILSGQDIVVQFHYRSSRVFRHANVNLAFNVYNSTGLLLTNLNTRDTGETELDVFEEGYFECLWHRFNLRTGTYNCTLFCEVNGEIQDWLQAAFQLHVEDGDYYGTGSIIDRSQGDVLVDYGWRGKALD